MSRPRIQLGDLARDIVTGFEGIVVARTAWISGCDRLTLQPRTLHEGKRIESQSFDVSELDLIESQAVKKLDDEMGEGPGTGGPRPEPQRR